MLYMFRDNVKNMCKLAWQLPSSIARPNWTCSDYVTMWLRNNSIKQIVHTIDLSQSRVHTIHSIMNLWQAIAWRRLIVWQLAQHNNGWKEGTQWVILIITMHGWNRTTGNHFSSPTKCRSWLTSNCRMMEYWKIFANRRYIGKWPVFAHFLFDTFLYTNVCYFEQKICYDVSTMMRSCLKPVIESFEFPCLSVSTLSLLW